MTHRRTRTTASLLVTAVAVTGLGLGLGTSAATADEASAVSEPVVAAAAPNEHAPAPAPVEVESPGEDTEHAETTTEDTSKDPAPSKTSGAAAASEQQKASEPSQSSTTSTARAEESDVAHVGERYEGPGGVAYYVPEQIVAGEPITISGTGWTTTSGSAGSVIGVKLDEGGVSTTLEVRHPVTGAIQGNKTIIGIAAADSTGEWTVTMPFPTLASSNQAWVAGQTHSVRLLTGSLTPGDATRSQTASFTITDGTAAAVEPPAWPHQSVAFTDPITGKVATAWVESAVAAGDASTIRVKGTGWTDAAGTRGSTIALKLNSGVGTQYPRTGADVVQHPTASGDDTIWALVTRADGTDRPHVFPIDGSGSFEVALDAPRGLVTGQYLAAQLQSGRFLPGDVQRTVATQPIVVGGVPWVDGSDDEQITCVPSTATPTVSIVEPSASVGGTVHVRGTGWCHPAEKAGGSVVAFKIDEGGYSRLTTAVHQNKTIWAVAAADAATGDFDTLIQLPDGTTSGANGSAPAFTTGAHTLRLLSGSLKAGDTVRTLESAEFVAGTYRPNGLPPLVQSDEDLTSATSHGLTVSRSSTSLDVTVPGAAEDDWVFLTAYASDGSPRYPWGTTWFRADRNGRVDAPLAGATLPSGTSKLTAQSGNRGEVGRLLGWDSLTVAEPASKPAPTKEKSPRKTTPVVGRTPTGVTVPSIGAAPVSSTVAPTPAMPATAPPVPFQDADGFTDANAGGVTGVQNATIVLITLPSVAPGEWVYLYAYSDPLGVGWVQVDADRQITVDVAKLAPGVHHLALLDRDGALVGWTTATVDESEQQAAPGAATAAPVLSGLTSGTVGREWMTGTDWWLLSAGLLVLLAGIGSAVWAQRTPPTARGARP